MSAFSKPSTGERPKPPTFSEMDANGDGSVTFKEFSRIKLPARLDAISVFGQIDNDDDGHLSEQEVKSFRPPRPVRQ